ncbi:MAG: cofactor-independent phosphoglycerate mutase [Actinomycetota bacterium]|nr:cofactor-independent phosphoglycerate mutase [Actinomycetota bacterium]
MKYLVLVPDGAADRPVEKHGGLTPLDTAHIPNMDFLAKNGICGTAITVPPGMSPGSDVANYSIMGYDPRLYYTGRGPLEAVSMGVELSPKDVAFRCNLVTEGDGRLLDFSASHISSGEAAELMGSLQEELGDDETRFYPGVSYRHLLVLHGDDYLEDVCHPPHDVVGGEVGELLPRGPGSERLVSLMRLSAEILSAHPINSRRKERGEKPANMIWPWGQGRAPSLPGIPEKYGLSGAIITAVDLLKGLGVHAGLEVVGVPGATGYYDTDYKAKALYALQSLYHRDLVYVHVEAPDEAGHEGNWEAKVQALEDFDRHIVSTLLNELSRFREDFSFLVLPDHPTPVELRTHVADPVPFALYYLEATPDGGSSFSERGVRGGSLPEMPAWELMDLLVGTGT